MRHNIRIDAEITVDGQCCGTCKYIREIPYDMWYRTGPERLCCLFMKVLEREGKGRDVRTFKRCDACIVATDSD